MNDASQNFFRRSLDRVASFIRPVMSQDHHIAAMDQKVQAAENKEYEERARDEAIAAFGQLVKSRFDAAAMQYDLRDLDAANDDVSTWSERDWQDADRIRAKVLADMQTVARAENIAIDSHEGVVAAFETLTEVYDAVQAEVNVRREDAHEHDDRPYDDSPPIVYTGQWRFEDYGQTESRDIVVKTEAGFHAGVETSYMGGDGPIAFSDMAFDNPAKARELASSFARGGDEALEIASKSYDQAVAKIHDLSAVQQLSLGQQSEMWGALTEIGLGLNNVRPENTAALDVYSQDKDQRAVLAASVERHRDEMESLYRLTNEAERAGIDRHNGKALDTYVEETYGSAEGYLRQNRVLDTLKNMAAAYREGLRPMFQSREDAESFRSDVDRVFGEGTFARMREGNTDALIPHVRSEREHMAMGSALQVAIGIEKRGESYEKIEAQNEAIRLENGIKGADWYAHFSDDSDVRMRGARETERLGKELTEYAGRSPEHAAWISQSYDTHGPSEGRKFSGYVKEADRAAVGAFPTPVEAKTADVAAAITRDNERGFD